MPRKQNTTGNNKSTELSGVIVSKTADSLKASTTQHKQNVTNGIDRHEMIAMAAYYRSQKRGFNNGDEIQDWLDAEAEFDGLI
jgi:hypothetical protein